MPFDLAADFSSPTPFVSMLSALVVLGLFTALLLIASFFSRRRKLQESEGNALSALLAGLGTVDRTIVHGTSWVTGTRHNRHWMRVLHVSLFFLSMSALGALLPWPWGFMPIISGLIGMFGVFRHYSRHEDELVFEVPSQSRFINIDGHLHREVIIAVSFLFVFAPIAFAQLQQHGFGFDVAPDAGPFTFVIYTAIETLKSGSLVDYYDLYAERVGFVQIAAVDNPSPWAKYAIIVYRISLNLVVLATIKRLIDIASRRSRGLDMRRIENQLLSTEDSTRENAIARLSSHALEGSRLARLNATSILSGIVAPTTAHRSNMGADDVFSASVALYLYAEQFADPQAMWTAILGFRNSIGAYSRADDRQKWADSQNFLGNALSDLGERTGDSSRLEEAVDAYCSALEVRNQDVTPEAWAQTQNNLAGVFVCLAEATGNSERLHDAIGAYESALEVFSPDIEPHEWAFIKMNLGSALNSLGEQEDDPVHFRAAISSLREALEVSNLDGEAGAASDVQIRLGTALNNLGLLERDSEIVEEGVAIIRAALNALTLETNPTQWALANFSLANGYGHLWALEEDPQWLERAASGFRASLAVYTRETMPTDWIATLRHLAAVLAELGRSSHSVQHLSEAIELYEMLKEFDFDNNEYRELINEIHTDISVVVERSSTDELS